MLDGANEQMVGAAAALSKQASRYLEGHPKAQSAVARGQYVVAKGTSFVSSGARKVTDAVPDGVADWSVAAFASLRTTVGRLSRAGLSSKQVVKQHQRRGHDVARLLDVRRLDLEEVDAVRGRAAAWYYPAIAALSGRERDW